QTLGNTGNLAQIMNGGTFIFNYPNSVKDKEEVFCDFNNRNLSIEFKILDQPSYERPVSLEVSIIRGTNSAVAVELRTANSTYKPQQSSYSRLGPDALQRNADSLRIVFDQFNSTVRQLADTIYIGAFRNAINAGAADSYYDIAVGQGFVSSWREYKSGDTRRYNVLAKQITDDISSIFGVGLEINPSPNSQTLKLMVDGRSYKLDDVGSGLAQFIVVLASVAMRNPAFVLIDEPELNLHPSLQVSFLTTLASYAKQGVLFSTHSIGLARAVADWVYAVRRISHGRSDVRMLEKLPRYSEFLGELSFNGYQELGFDAILLVEGSTEVRTVQQILRRMKIDHQLVLLPLGGSGMINGAREEELMEIKRISKNVSALIDSEELDEIAPLLRGRQEFVEACERAGIHCHVLKRRATENYFTDSAIKAVKGDNYRALGPYEKLESANPKWAKSENWRIARQMQLEDLTGTDLLGFFEALRTRLPRATSAGISRF